MRKKKIIFSLVAVVGLIGCIVQAEEASTESLKIPEEKKIVLALSEEIPVGLQKMVDDANVSPKNKNYSEIIADVSIRNAEASELKKNHIKIVFDLENSMETQAGLIYGLELIKKYPDKREVLMDIKTFPKDLLTVEEDGTLHREINYLAPDYLSGDFVLWLKVKNESGLVLALQSFNVNFAGTGRYLEQSSHCYLSIEGEKDQKYNLRQGVDLKKEEKLFLNCQTKNLTGEDILVTPKFEFYRRDLYGLKIDKNVSEMGSEVAFATGEDKLVQLAIPLPADPQAYDVKVVFQKEKMVISNPIVAHFVVAGKSASISQLTLNKDKYQAGETAKLGIIWSGPADTFRNSRTGGSGLIDPIFEIEIKNQDGKTFCVPTQTKKSNEFEKNIKIELNQDCIYPIVTVRILDEGQLLYEKMINTLPEKEIKKNNTLPVTSKSNFNLLIVILFSVCILIIFFSFGMLYWKNKKNGGDKSGRKKLIILFFFFPIYFLANQAQAETATLYDTPYLQTAHWKKLTGANWVEWGACVYDDLPKCPLLPVLPGSEDYCYFGDYAIWYNNHIYGCYQDVVAFSYDLSSTEVNQGETITASGTTTGYNLCRNGVTVNMSVIPKSSMDSQKIFDDFWFNDTYVMHEGSIDFSTADWNCRNYKAKFYYSFNHTEEVSSDGSINYSVNNCCSSTCSTGPGCRRIDLTHGSVATSSGTCCRGASCYDCDSGYYWNNSMCTAYTCQDSIPINAVAFDEEESTPPIPASISWSYSSSDTETKCQFDCDDGYHWDGSNCVVDSSDDPSCSASWNPKGPIAVGETSTLSWSSTGDADGWLEYVCTGPVPETGSTKVDEYPWAYETTEAGTEKCSFTAKNSAGKTATCSASLVIQDSSCEVTCNNNHQPGCMESEPSSSYETDDECCDLSKKCYECSGSYSWDPTNEKCVVCEKNCSTESTGPGCISGDLDHANEVSDSECCGGERCYQCDSGYVWDSATSKCVSTNNGRWIEVKPN